MQINHAKTKVLFDDAGLCQAKIARQIEVTPSLFGQVLNGTYRFMESDTALRVIAKLKALKVLVVES